MANKCVNINNEEFKQLVEQSGLSPLELSAEMGVWMEDTQTDEWPTLQQLGIKPIKAEITQDFGWYANRVYSDEQVRNLKARINRFNEKNPGIEYKFTEYEWGGNSYKGNLTYKVTSTEPKTVEKKTIYYPSVETTDERRISDQALLDQEGPLYEQRIDHIKLPKKEIRSILYNQGYGKLSPNLESLYLNSSRLKGFNISSDKASINYLNSILKTAKKFQTEITSGGITHITDLVEKAIKAVDKQDYPTATKLGEQALSSLHDDISRAIVEGFIDDLNTESFNVPNRFVVKGKEKGYSTDTWFYKEDGEWYMKNVPFNSPFNTEVEDFDITKMSKAGLGIDEVVESYIETLKSEQRKESGMPLEVRADFEKKKASMLKTFPFVTDVIEDDTIPVAGLVEAGGNVIRVNPKFWTVDTIGHEFAHILIDSIGGLSNPLVAKGIELLKDSDIWTKTAKRYPDLVEANDGRFEKEVLAQAIGEETVVLYDQTKQSQFVRWLQQIIKKIKDYFGFETDNEVTKLARRVISGTPVEKGDVGYAEARTKEYMFTQEELYDEDLNAPEDEETKITNIEKLRDKIKSALERKSSIYSRKRRNINKDRLDKILADINKEDNDPVESLKDFLNYAYTQTKTIHNELRTIIDHTEPLIREGEPYDVSLEKLARWNDYITGFNELDDLSNFAFRMEEYLKDTEQIKKFKEIINPKIIKETIDMRNEIRDFWLKEGKLQVAKFLTPHYRGVEADYKEKAERRFNKIYSKSERKKMSAVELRQKKRDYIKQYVDYREGKIKKETEQVILQELDKASKDVGIMGRWIDTALDTSDVLLASVVDAFQDQHYKARQENNDLHREFLDILRDLENQVSDMGITGDLSKAYDFMLEVDQNGDKTNHRVEKYRSSMWDAYNSFKDKIEGFDWKSKDNLDWLVDNGYIDEVDRNDIYNDDMLDIEAREKALSGWKSINVPFEDAKWDEYDKARNTYIRSLEEDKKINKTEYERLKDYTDGYRFVIKDNNENQLGSQTGYKNYKEAKKNMLFLKDKKLRVTKNEVSDIINSEAAELYIEWLRKNSWNYRSPINAWVNPQYFGLAKIANGGQTLSNPDLTVAEELIRNSKDPRLRFYNFITDKLDYVQKNMPSNNRLLSRLPGAIKSTGERITSEDNTLKTSLKHTLKEAFDVQADETERGVEQITDEKGNKIQFVPVYYTNNLSKEYEEKFDELSNKQEVIDSYSKSYNSLPKSYKDSITLEEHAKKKWTTKESIKDQSYDLATSYYKYFFSAINYKHKQEILSQIEAARYFMGERKVAITKGGKPVYKKGTEEEQTITGKESKIYQQAVSWIEANMYGIRDVEHHTIFKGKVDVTKLVNWVNKYTSLNLLAGNVVTGTMNVFIGESNQFIEAFGGDNFTKKDLIRARTYYFKNLMGIIDDIGRRHPKHVVNLLNKEFDTINEYDGNDLRKNTKFRELMQLDSAYFLTGIGEHFMQTATMIAMLDNEIAKVGDEVVGSMLKMAKVKNNKLVFETEDGRAITNFDTTDRSDFAKKTKKILSGMHGEYSTEGRNEAQRYAAGKLGMMFRKFIVPGYKRRWGKAQFDNQLIVNKEGYYLTTGRFLKDIIKHLFALRWTMVSSKWEDMLDGEKARVRKGLVEIGFMLSSMVLGYVLTNMEGDDDDNDWALSFLTYQALRYRAEIMFFANPGETMRIMRSPMASMSVVENMLRFTGNITSYLYSGFEFAEYERGNWKGKKKITKTMVNFIPVVKQGYRAVYIDDQISFFKMY